MTAESRGNKFFWAPYPAGTDYIMTDEQLSSYAERLQKVALSVVLLFKELTIL